jgi:hypothetical protein
MNGPGFPEVVVNTSSQTDFPEAHFYRHSDFDFRGLAFSDFTHHPATAFKINDPDNRRSLPVRGQVIYRIGKNTPFFV